MERPVVRRIADGVERVVVEVQFALDARPDRLAMVESARAIGHVISGRGESG